MASLKDAPTNNGTFNFQLGTVNAVTSKTNEILINSETTNSLAEIVTPRVENSGGNNGIDGNNEPLGNNETTDTNTYLTES